MSAVFTFLLWPILAVGMEFLDNEGSGLYRLQSKINHSCEPNLEIVFPKSNHRVGVKTVRDIQPGEELLIRFVSFLICYT